MSGAGDLGLTPGPWEALRRNVVDGQGRVLAVCVAPTFPVDQQFANTRAMAATPLLIAAVTAAEEVVGDGPRTPEADRAYRLILDALAVVRTGRLPE